MKKKDFKKGFSGLLGEGESSPSKAIGEIQEIKKLVKKETAEKRATFIVSTNQLDALKAIAFWDRRLLKDILYDSLEQYISTYQKKNGEIKYPEK